MGRKFYRLGVTLPRYQLWRTKLEIIYFILKFVGGLGGRSGGDNDHCPVVPIPIYSRQISRPETGCRISTSHERGRRVMKARG